MPLIRVEAATGSPLAAYAWFRAEPLPGFGGATPDQLLREGRADRLIAAGYAGMRVRSFAAGTGADDLNLVMWRWSSERPASVVLIDDEGRLGEGAVR